MTDIIDRLKEPEAHYPGNFDTPKRANAMLSCLCQEAMEEIESLRRELAASQAREQQLREALRVAGMNCVDDFIAAGALQLADTPADTAALESMITKAGEVMRERMIGVLYPDRAVDVIREIPAVTLNLKGGA